MKYIKKLNDVSLEDVSLVGGKNANLGQMITNLTKKGLKVPLGFALTSDAYWHFINYNKLAEPIKKELSKLTDTQNLPLLQEIGTAIRSLIKNGVMPDDLQKEIAQSYQELADHYHTKDLAVAVRSSGTAEDLPGASFAGQMDTFLHVIGIESLVSSCKNCFASLFTDRAIIYRIDKGFDHFKVALSVGVQKMVRSDLGSAGVMFTLDTETGFDNIIVMNASYGLGEAVVQGMVNPDEFRVHKPTLRQGYKPIVKKFLGDKPIKIVYGVGKDLTEEVPVGLEEYNKFSISDDDIISLAQQALIIEDYYSAKKGSWEPMDIEWAKDGLDHTLYIIQARPETVHGRSFDPNQFTQYRIKNSTQAERAKKVILKGQSIGQAIVSGKARVVNDINEIEQFNQGDILVTTMTDPDWVTLMKKAGGIITNRGGRTSHAAIVSRELGVPALVGTQDATSTITDGQMITLDCSQGTVGFVYDGSCTIEKEKIDIRTLPKIPVDLLLNMADPDHAIRSSFLPVKGVGLARLEFIISDTIKVHPMAALNINSIKDEAVRKEIMLYARAYENPQTFFIDTLAQGIGMIAAAFYPRKVLVRFSDFKSNEYRNLIGGKYFEPKESNPMLGLRGASRYYSDLYSPAFALECAAIKKAREDMGLKNIQLLIPFVRTIDEAKRVTERIAKHGLSRSKELEIYMMCEVPANVILIDQFAKLFDGISIGSNDLTQMTLAVDRDSALLSSLFDERNEAVKIMMKSAIEGAQRNKIHSGICGQAPSDYPEIAKFLIDCGIDSISLNTDTILSFLYHWNKVNS